jgi:hypothetical protein
LSASESVQKLSNAAQELMGEGNMDHGFGFADGGYTGELHRPCATQSWMPAECTETQRPERLPSRL